MLCDYGCGQEAIHQLKNGKWCCNKKYQACPKNKNIPWNKGKVNIYSENTLKVMSERKKGIKLSESHKRSLSLVRKGKKKSLEHKLKISTSLKGKEKSEIHKKNLSKSQKGIPRKKHTEETKKKIRENQLGSKNSFYGKKHSNKSKQKMSRKEDKNPNWNGGISKEPYPFYFNILLKEFIKKRDEYKCKICGCKNDKKLCIHHIDYDKNNCNYSNLLTLCRACHSKTNFNRKIWKIFFEHMLDTSPFK